MASFLRPFQKATSFVGETHLLGPLNFYLQHMLVVGPELKTLSLDLISVTSKRCLEELGQKRRELKILAEEVAAISAQRMGKLGFGDFATLGVRKTVSFVRVVY